MVSKVISTLIGVISSYKYNYLHVLLVTKSHDPFSIVPQIPAIQEHGFLEGYLGGGGA